MSTYHQTYYQKNRDKAIKKATKYAKENPKKVALNKRKAFLRFKYNISLEDYQDLFDKQGGLCAICETFQERYLDIDHDHYTGKIRGLLCRACNIGIGHLQDSPAVVEAALRYLERTPDVTEI